MNKDKRYFLVTLGPTGSGKGGVKDIVSSYLRQNRSRSHYYNLGILLEQSSTKILVDDLVESHPHYKKKVKEILDNANTNGRTRKQIAESTNDD